MKILILSDEECPAYWDNQAKERLRPFDLIISCGDLRADYLSYIVTMARCPVLYVHGNHDSGYLHRPPEGCDCIDDRLVVYNGLRILGLGGCRKYHDGPFHYTEKQMQRRIQKLRWCLWRSHGADIIVTHSPIEHLGDGEDVAHRGFHCLQTLVEKYKPAYLFHGHMHLRYGSDRTRVRRLGSTQVINATERYILEIPDREVPERHRNQIIWKNGSPDTSVSVPFLTLTEH